MFNSVADTSIERHSGVGCEQMGDGHQKVQTSDYKINKSRDLTYSVVTTVITVLCA